MQDERLCGAVGGAVNATADGDTCLTPSCPALSRIPPFTTEKLARTEPLNDMCMGSTEPRSTGVIASISSQRSIFTEDGSKEEDEDEHVGFGQVFSVDTTVAAVETTMQPGANHRSGRLVGVRPPFRARRVLNLMDRLMDENDKTVDHQTANSPPDGGGPCSQLLKRAPQTEDLGYATAVASGTAAADADDVDDNEASEQSDTLFIRRKWKRRLIATPEDSQPPPPPVERPAFGRSYSSQSVFLDRPKLTFASTSTAHAASDQASTTLTSNAAHELVLPTVRSSSHPDLNVISPHTVASLLQGDYQTRLDSFSLIDCRFEYEFHGGSLHGALSMTNPATVEDYFLRKPPRNSSRVALIFYCEFSANRAPKMLRHIRNLDRWIHAERYPELFYPELYLIDGGYKNCYLTLKDVVCGPSPLYRSMNDKAFVDQCKKDFGLHRANWKLHKSTNCASKFQQLHRRIHSHHHDNDDDGATYEGASGEEEGHGDGDVDEEAGVDGDVDLLVRPLALRSFSQQN